MTTFTITGYLIGLTPLDTASSLKKTTLSIVVDDDSPFISYTRTSTGGLPDEYVHVASEFSSLRIDSKTYTHSSALLLDAEAEQITWNGGVSNVFSIDLNAKNRFLFQMSGSPIPDMNSATAYNAFLSGITRVQLLNWGVFGPDNNIPLSKIPTSHQTEHDLIEGGPTADTLSGGRGRDTLHGNAATDKIYGEAGNDVLYGGAGSDTIYGGAGNDRAYGGTHNDLIYGGQGKDALYGDGGADIIFGGGGNDAIRGGSGNDQLNGGTGNDKLWGEAGHDLIRGGEGADTLYGGEGNDTLYSGSWADMIHGGTGSDKLYGETGYDQIWGEAGADMIYGGSGNDTLYGGSGADTIYGGTGSDTLYGGSGADVLYGGAWADVFVFANRADFGRDAQADVIADFQTGIDRVDLRGLGLSFGGANFSGEARSVRFITRDGDGRLQIDFNGDSILDAEIILTDLIALDARDLLI